MTAVKQLSLEHEVLQQYSHLYEQICKFVALLSHRDTFSIQFIFNRIRRNNSILTALAYGVYWTLDGYTIVLLYWCTLNLLAQNKLKPEDRIM